MSNKAKKNIVKSTRILTIIMALALLLSIVFGITSQVYADTDDIWDTAVRGAELGVGAAISKLFCGIPAIFATLFEIVILAIGFSLQVVMSAIYSGLERSIDWVSVPDIIFAGSGNASNFLDVNFLDFKTNADFKGEIAKWYYILRLISAAVLLVILIYIGIRMALSTIAQEQAKYKQMLVDWVTSLALLFLLHYIIMFAIQVNKALVDAIYALRDNTNTNFFHGFNFNSIISAVGVKGLFLAFLYSMYIGQIFTFFLLYMKRMITVGFLIMIAPLITITYSIDKIGDGKSQALNAWLKELVYNILIQPFHCIIYLAFFGAISNITETPTIATYVFAIIVMKFMKKAEDILKKIFHFDANSMGSMSESAQSFMNATGKFVKMGASAGKLASNFRAAGGWKAVRELKSNRVAKKELKKEFTEKQKNKDNGSKMSFKEYLNSSEGQERFKSLKAEDLAKRAETRRDKIRNKAKEAYDKEHEEGDFEKLEKQAKEEDANGNLTENAKKAQGIIRAEKNKVTTKKDRVINGFSGAYGKISDGYQRFKQSDYGQLVTAGAKDITKVASAIALGGVGLGASGELNDAVSLGQLGYGLATGALENTKGSLANDCTDMMEKYMKMKDITDPEEISKILNAIKTDGMTKGYDKIMEDIRQMTSQIAAMLGGDRTKAEQITQEMKLNFLNPKENFDLNDILSKNGVTDENDRQEILQKMQPVIEKFAESQIFNHIQKSESVGIDVDSLGGEVEKKVEKHTKYIERTQRTNINVQVRQGNGGTQVDVESRGEDGSSSSESRNVGGNPQPGNQDGNQNS